MDRKVCLRGLAMSRVSLQCPRKQNVFPPGGQEGHNHRGRQRQGLPLVCNGAMGVEAPNPWTSGVVLAVERRATPKLQDPRQGTAGNLKSARNYTKLMDSLWTCLFFSPFFRCKIGLTSPGQFEKSWWWMTISL